MRLNKIYAALLLVLTAVAVPSFAESNLVTPQTSFKNWRIAATSAPKKSKQDTVPKLPSAKEDIKNYKNLPNQELTSDLMFNILMAEVASQRSQYAYSYKQFMALADKTRDPRLAKRAAEIAVQEKDSNHALDAIRRWYQLEPTSPEAERFYLGFMFFEGKMSEIASFYKKKLAEAPAEKRFVIFYQLQQLMASAKDKKDAFYTIKEVVEPYKNTYDGHVTMALAAINMGDKALAKSEASAALALKPDSDTAILTLAQVANTTDEAIAILEKYLKEHPKADQVRTALARVYVSLKRYPEATRHFEALLANDPNNLSTMYSLAILAVERHDNQTAKKYLQRYIAYVDKSAKKEDLQEEQTVQVLFLLAELSAESREYDRALYWLSRVKTNDDEDVAVTTQVKQAQIYAKKGNIGKAKQILNNLRNQYADEAEKILIAEAQILRDANLAEQAFQILEAGLKEAPSSTNLLYDYGLTAEALGKYDVMENAMKKVISIDPSFAQAYNALGYSYVDRNINLSVAEPLLAKAMALSPNDAYITDSWGWLLFRTGRLQEAEVVLRRAASIRPEPEIMLHLSEVLWVQGKQDDAKLLLQQIQKVNPTYAPLVDLLNRLNIKL